MNRYIRNSRKLVVLAPAVALATSAAATAALAALAAPAHADGGPVAYLTTDTTGRNALGPVADKATPVVRSAGMTMDSLTNSTSVYSSAARTGALSRLGPGTLKTARGDMRFSSMAVRCGSRVDEVLYGVMALEPQSVAGPALQGVPQHPTVNYRVPSAVPDKEIVLNRQVHDATGALTVTAMTVTDKATGVTRGYGVARCTPSTVPADARNPLPVPGAGDALGGGLTGGPGGGLTGGPGGGLTGGPGGGLTGGPAGGLADGLGGAAGSGAGKEGALPPAAVDSLRGMLNTVNLGTLPKEPPSSGWGAALDPEQADFPNLGAPGAPPRPTGRERGPGESIDSLHQVPGRVDAAMTSLPGMVARPLSGTLPASTGAVLGGAPGLRLIG